MVSKKSRFDQYDDVVGFLVNRASFALRRSLRVRFEEAGFSVTPEEFMVLQRIADAGSISQRELAERTLKDSPAVSRAIARFGALGYVDAAVSSDDRRLRLIALTTAGARVHGQLRALADANLDAAEQGVSASDLRIAKKVLRAIWENLET